MTGLLLSTIRLALCIVPGLVHGVETLRPLWARWVVNWVLPVFGPGLPLSSNGLNRDEQQAMLDAARAAAPRRIMFSCCCSSGDRADLSSCQSPRPRSMG